MSEFSTEFHAKLAFFKERFSQDSYEIAVSFFHSLYDGMFYVKSIDGLLEGCGTGNEVESCDFPFSEDQADYYGVKFVRDLSWDNPEEYRENVVPFDVFLDMLRASVEWHLRRIPTDEMQLRRYFHERNLALRSDGSDFPSQDDGETWWRKCDEKRVLNRSLRVMAQIHAPYQSAIDVFFVYLPEPLMLEFLRAATQRLNYESFYGNRLETLLAQNATFFRGVLLDFSSTDEVQFIERAHTKSEETKQEDSVCISNQTFDTLLQTVASAYAQRRPQHANVVSNLMQNRIK